MNIKGLHEFFLMQAFFVPAFFLALNKCLAAKTSRQALKTGHCCQPIDPFCAPVCCAVRGFALTRHSARRVALILSCLLVGIGIAAAAALYAIELTACRKLFAFVPTSQMPVDVEMDNHKPSPCDVYEL
jgi:hypothetical protein